MFRSLRFKLPALFLAVAALAGLVSTIISIGLSQDYTEDRLRAELRREARGLTALYAEQAARAIDAERPTLRRLSRATRQFEQASGSRIYYVGLRIFFSQGSGLRGLVEWWRAERAPSLAVAS